MRKKGGHFPKGRGTAANPPNRFEKIETVPDSEWLDHAEAVRPETSYLSDASRTILARNDSPDIAFDFSINPYRGCEHGCVYCYARPTHEYFGFSSGLDFETKIIVKKNAPALLDAEFSRAGWQPQVVALSGNTDCYQPVERTLGLTRKCLRVFLAHRNPVAMITKNALVLRDLDILKELAALGLVSVAISITTMDNELTRVMEPRTSAPHKRFAALAALIESGIPACVMIAPVIPGINDHEIPAILAHAASLGVQRASYILLRLPYQVKELFSGWLQQHFPDKKNKVLNTVMETRAGKLNDPNFGKRMSGTGVRAETIRRIFEVNCRKYHMNEAEFILRTDLFVRAPSNQMILF